MGAAGGTYRTRLLAVVEKWNRRAEGEGKDLEPELDGILLAMVKREMSEERIAEVERAIARLRAERKLL